MPAFLRMQFPTTFSQCIPTHIFKRSIRLGKLMAVLITGLVALLPARCLPQDPQLVLFDYPLAYRSASSHSSSFDPIPPATSRTG